MAARARYRLAEDMPKDHKSAEVVEQELMRRFMDCKVVAAQVESVSLMPEAVIVTYFPFAPGDDLGAVLGAVEVEVGRLVEGAPVRHYMGGEEEDGEEEPSYAESAQARMEAAAAASLRHFLPMGEAAASPQETTAKEIRNMEARLAALEAGDAGGAVYNDSEDDEL